MISDEEWSLLAKYFAGETNKKENQIIQSWLRNSEKKELIEKASTLWEENSPNTISFNTERIKYLLTQKMEHQEQQNRPDSSPSLISFWKNIAATVSIVLIVGAGIYFSIYTQSDPVPSSLTYLERSNPEGKRSSFKLADGTIVHLNVASTLRIPEQFASDIREVYLSGEAYFEIARNQQKPFLVHAGNLVTRVLGTSFNVKAFPADKNFEVVVASGKVGVSSSANTTPNSNLTLMPGQQAIFDRNQANFSINEVDVNLYTGWKNGDLNFDHRPIKYLFQELERWYGVTIQVNNPQLLQKEFSGEFSNMSLKEVLQGISFSLDFQFEINQDSVLIY